MASWTYVEPGDDGVTPVYVTLSEEQIIAEYYAWWSEQMLRIGKADQISAQNCIEDWVTVHWAAKRTD